MSEDEYTLIEALMQRNETMRVIAVGDDDQNIFAFRGSDSKYLRKLLVDHEAVQYELTENFRSASRIVAFSNDYAQRISVRMKTKPAISHRKAEGKVVLIHHTRHHFERAIVNELLQSDNNKDCAVLTSTNEEAFLIYNEFRKEGLNAKLIQSRGDVQLFNLLEIRSLLVYLQKRLNGEPIVSRQLWNEAKTALEKRFKASRLLQNCLRLIALFESVTPKEIYLSDFEEFVRDSQLEDTFEEDLATIFVSTIHKAKGHEFDTVYLYLDNVEDKTDEEKRRLFVGMTRAKNSLQIHYSGSLFNEIDDKGIIKVDDLKTYDQPNEIVLSLTLADVYLDFVAGKKSILCQFRSGQRLTFKNNTFYGQLNGKNYPCAYLSKACQLKIQKQRDLGYVPVRAEINFIVAWVNQTKEETEAVVLPNLYFVRLR